MSAWFSRIFQSTLPGWGATPSGLVQPAQRRDFNPRSPDGERRVPDGVLDRIRAISIHAPRMGSDESDAACRGRRFPFQSTLPGWGATFSWRGLPPTVDISIHAPRMGSDFLTTQAGYQGRLFQSTLPGWGATRSQRAPHSPSWYFNPRSPDGERPRKWTSSPTIWAKSSIFNTDCIADRR